MINLLPYDIKKQTQAARMNVILLKYILVMILAAAFLALSIMTTYFIIESSKPSQTQSQTANKDSATNKYKTDLTIAKIVLDQRVSYSTILTNLGAAMPEGAIITSINLSDSTMGVPVSLVIKAKSADIEPQLKANLQSSNFSGYQLTSSGTDPDGSSVYPVIFNVNLTFNKVIN